MEQTRPEKATSGNSSIKPVDSFRATCDNCANSKVRCSKEQPSCQRCMYQRVPCTYSPSQRRKKKRRSTLPPSPPSTTTAPSAGGLPATAIQPSPEPVSRSLPSTGMMSTAGEYDMMDTENTPLTHHDNNDLSYMNILDADYDDALDWGDVITSSESPRPPQQDSLPSPAPVPVGDWFSSNLLNFGSLDEADIFNLSPLYDNDQSKSLPEKPKTTRDGHMPCPHLANATLQSLNRPPASCTREGSYSTLRPTLSLGNVLKMNHKAINNLITMLNCECGGKPDMALQMSLIILRILWWYQASLDPAIHQRNTRLRESETTTLSSSSESPRPTSSRHQPENSSAPPSLLFFPSSSSSGSTARKGETMPPPLKLVSIPLINIGNYTLDEEHSDRMVKQLILTKLIQLKEVVGAFSQRSSSHEESISSAIYTSSRTMVTPETPSRNQLHFALGAYLRNQLKITIMKARDQIGSCGA